MHREQKDEKWATMVTVVALYADTQTHTHTHTHWMRGSEIKKKKMQAEKDFIDMVFKEVKHMAYE